MCFSRPCTHTHCAASARTHKHKRAYVHTTHACACKQSAPQTGSSSARNSALMIVFRLLFARSHIFFLPSEWMRIGQTAQLRCNQALLHSRFGREFVMIEVLLPTRFRLWFALNPTGVISCPCRGCFRTGVVCGKASLWTSFSPGQGSALSRVWTRLWFASISPEVVSKQGLFESKELLVPGLV